MPDPIIVLLCVAVGLLTWALLRLRREHQKLRRKERRSRRMLQAMSPMLAVHHHRVLKDAMHGYGLAKLAAGGRSFRLPPALRSQFGEDAFLLDLFAGQETGYYVEAGATDGLHLSVSYVFEALGWTGCLVEPLSDLAAACRTNRPHSHVVEAALASRDSEGTTSFTRVTGGYWASDLSSVELNPYLRAQVDEYRFETTEVTVPVTWLDRVLEEAGAPIPIDFVVLDVEGTELDVLDGFDLARYAPRVLIVEDHREDDDPRLLSHFERAGYVCAGRLALNLVFVHGDEPGLVKRARHWLRGDQP